MTKSEDVTNDPELQAMIEEEAADESPATDTETNPVLTRLVRDLQRRVLELEKTVQRLPSADGVPVKDPASIRPYSGRTVSLNVGGNRVEVPYYNPPANNKKKK